MTKLAFEEYQHQASGTAVYPEANKCTRAGITYCALGLVNEAGEVAGKVKKVMRGDTSMEEQASAIASELGDTLWYLAQLATELGYDLGWIAQGNITKLSDRAERGTIRGSGDNR